MSTDGVKIIDGDTAHDTYWGIMDLYDGGATFETIKARMPFPQTDVYDDFDYEVHTTAYALAAWEIGLITVDIIREVKRVIDEGACVKTWTEEYDSKSGKQRQKELDKLWEKINSTNTKVRQRKKYKLIGKFLYDINDVLTFQLEGSLYYATILLDITQYRGSCTYRFGKILFKSETLPTISDIEKCKILGRKIPTGFTMDSKDVLPGDAYDPPTEDHTSEILNKLMTISGNYTLGMNMTGIDHRELINISDKLKKIGNLNLREVCKQMGSLSGATTFEDLTYHFGDMDNYIKLFREGAIKIKALLT